MTWFRLGGTARYLFRPHNVTDLCAFVRLANDEGLAVRVLGAGANVLIDDDGFDGVVIRLENTSFRRVTDLGDGRFSVGGGSDLMPLSRRMSEEGWSGLECMAGIPATVGGAARMNAGGRFGDFGTAVESVDIVRRDGSLARCPNKELDFAYRSSRIGDGIVVSAILTLRQEDPAHTRERFEACFDFKQRSQPLKDKSAGCIFKNPAHEPAGALIDRAGLKGLQYGGASVSRRHANFIVTDRTAKASDVIGLIDRVRARVHETFDTWLETEIDIWKEGSEQKV